MSNHYSSSVCKQCLTTLNEHIEYKESLIAKQKKLYSQVGSHSFVNVSIKEEPIEMNEAFTVLNYVEMCAVKTESDKVNPQKDLGNESELKLETQPAAVKKPRPRKQKIKNNSNVKVQSAVNPAAKEHLRTETRTNCKYCSKLLMKTVIRRHVSSLQPKKTIH